MDENVIFCRILLKMLRSELTAQQRKELKGSWSYMYDNRTGEFHVINEAKPLYWHGSAHNSYEARYNGINAWLQKYYPEAR